MGERYDLNWDSSLSCDCIVIAQIIIIFINGVDLVNMRE